MPFCVMNIYVYSFVCVAITNTIETMNAKLVHTKSQFLIVVIFNINLHANSNKTKHQLEYMQSQHLHEIWANVGQGKDYYWPDLDNSTYWTMPYPFFRYILEWSWCNHCIITFQINSTLKHMNLYRPSASISLYHPFSNIWKSNTNKEKETSDT